MDELVKFLFGLVGVFAFLNALYNTIMSYQAKSWQPVSGQIDDASFFITEDVDETFFNAKIRYHYRHNNKAFKGKRLAYGLFPSTVESFVLKPYLEATDSSPKTTVYVNPKNPKQAALVVGIRVFHLYTLVFFVVWNWAFYHFIMTGN